MPPPNHQTSSLGVRRCVRDEHAHVQVHGRRVRIARMQHQRHAHRLPRAAGEFRAARAVADGGSRSPVTCEKVDAAALEHVALLDQPRDAAAAFGPRPFVAAERPPVDRLEPRDDARLQAGK